MHPAGQQLSERLFYCFMFLTSLVCLIETWRTDDLRRFALFFAIGSTLALLACVPDWPVYRKKAITWREIPAAVSVPTSSSASQASTPR